ncbi:MAG: UDP-4-amino-4,6-dideoxy-N-acetyl-beta-L-altrosamine N-acetyltransferase [Helicobacter sp.]|nr:UDP-4-amino-4,6-dideoxy-N-acetyl-beta-L-altrosamine N-acetyltransferase [Helicobacter sp.]MDE6045562.1 UDP-4-amino-4,6-dideoxy-N-acetyl-beta-L-altrosamine N-acetyltransferase [Helicobacter sp.]
MVLDSRLATLRSNFTFGACKAVHFCALTPKQSESVRLWRNHPEIQKQMYNQEPITTQAHRSFIEGLQHSTARSYWAVFDEGRGIGTMSLVRINLVHAFAFLGIYINPDCFGTGSGTKILQLLEFVAFDKLKLHSLRLEVFEHNKRAIAFYERNGFVREGCLHDYAWVNHAFHNIILMGKIHA